MIVRGDVVRIPGPRGARGHEQRGTRYGVVVQSDDFQVLSSVVVVPTSRSVAPASFRPVIRFGESETRVHTQQVRTVDQSQLGEPVGHLTGQEMREIDNALRLLLELPRG